MNFKLENTPLDPVEKGKKYGTLVLAIALFVFLDLGVLILNYFLSVKFQNDALNINLAGRQRMLSQKITKSLSVAVHASRNIDRIMLEDSYREAYAASMLFGRTLDAFAKGGETTGADKHKVYVNAANESLQSLYIDKALRIWKPFARQLQDPNTISMSSLGALSTYMVKHNLQLLDLMNGLTVGLEKESSARAKTLRNIQTIAMVLVIANFIFILFHFIRQLRQRDSAILTYADGLLRHMESMERQVRMEKENLLSQLDSRNALVDDQEVQRRRRAVATALKQYLGQEQLMQALWIWEEDNTKRMPRISLFPFVKLITRKLEIKQNKEEMYMELTRCYALAEHNLDSDPLPQMQEWRSQNMSMDGNDKDPNSHVLIRLLRYIHALDAKKAIELRRHILSLQSQLNLSKAEQTSLRTWLLASDNEAQPEVAHNKLENIVGIVRSWCRENFPPLVYQQIDRLAA